MLARSVLIVNYQIKEDNGKVTTFQLWQFIRHLFFFHFFFAQTKGLNPGNFSIPNYSSAAIKSPWSTWGNI